MTDEKKSWFFVKDYQPTISEINSVLVDMHTENAANRTRIDSIESKLVSIESKLDKLIESHKNMINYFHAMENNDARQLNYKIRGFASGIAPPIPFKPEHLHHD